MRTLFCLLLIALPVTAKPNVLIVITDDQGFGDLGAHGNPILKTPQLDEFARQSTRLSHFYVSPVCSPTRSSLMTGRYNYRTGVVDTFIGRSMMHSEEITIAEILRGTGYRTGLFGKWHLGDNYPMRPQDQGFDEVLMHKGGGIAQPSDPPGGNKYQDPVLFHQGREKKYTGYCTDVFTDAAIEFIKQKSDRPFLAYVAYNCPHGPYQVNDADWRPYRDRDLTGEAFPKIGSPWTTPKMNTEEIARAYGMIANVDWNFGRLRKALPEDTLIIFLTDNGPGGVRWNGGLRNRKGTVYEGGIRVPCYVQWANHLPRGKSIENLPMAHIDLAPTILAACGVPVPRECQMDGQNLLPVIQGKGELPDRTLFIQWHRGDIPEARRAFAARERDYKLLRAEAGGKKEPKYELFQISKDPYELKDLATEQPEIVQRLLKKYDDWFADVKSTRNFQGPRIHIGNELENPTILTRQDWRGPKAAWSPMAEGHWELNVERAGRYQLNVDFAAAPEARKLQVRIGGITQEQSIAANGTMARFENLPIPTGTTNLEAWLEGSARSGITYARIEYLGK